MRICYVALDVEVPYTGMGGSGGSVHAYEVAQNLARLGHQVHLVCMKSMKKQRPQEILEGIEIHRIYTGADKVWLAKEKCKGAKELLDPLGSVLKSFFYTVLGFTVAKIAKKSDLIYERASSLGAGGFAAILTGKPLVLEVNDPLVSHISMRLARKVVTTDESILGKKMNKKKVTEVTWGCNTEMFNLNIDAREIIKKYNLDGKKIVIYIGAFAPWHGVDTIIECARIIRKIENVHDIVFLMVGTGPDLQKYRDKVFRKGLGDMFIFTGPVKYEEIPQYIGAADIAVAPFDPEKNPLTKRYGFFYTPLKIFEYMACGKPIISTSVGNIKKIIHNGVSGMLIRPGDHIALADDIIKLISDDNLRLHLGSNARKVVEEKYSWEDHAKQLQEIFEHALGKHDQKQI